MNPTLKNWLGNFIKANKYSFPLAIILTLIFIDLGFPSEKTIRTIFHANLPVNWLTTFLVAYFITSGIVYKLKRGYKNTHRKDQLELSRISYIVIVGAIIIFAAVYIADKV